MRRIVSGLDGEADAPAADVLVPGAVRLAPSEHWKPRDGAAAPRAIRRSARFFSSRRGLLLDRILLAVEVLAVVGLLVTMMLSFGVLHTVQEDVRAMPGGSPMATRTIRSVGSTRPAAARATSTPRPTNTRTPTSSPEPTAALPIQRVLPTRTPTRKPTATAVPTPESPTGVRIVIPAIDVDAPMVEGDDWETLKDGIGHRIGTAWPGEMGNAVIAAHNDVYGAIFKDLNSLEPGDIVIADTPTGVYRYEVVSSQVVLPTEISVTDPADEPVLTMITCYPPYVDTHRIVVRARLTE